MPLFEQVASLINGLGISLVFARIDVHANDIDDKDAKQYPTLKLYLKDDKNHPIRY